MSVVVLISIQNSVMFWRIVQRGQISTTALVPFSMYVAVFHSMLISSVALAPKASWLAENKTPLKRHLVTCVSAAACLVGFPLAQMKCFGQTSYQRQADAVVVLGCRTFADGKLSSPLYERVVSGCKLYREGLVQKVIFSGGPGDGDIHETDAMRRVAIKLGVDEDDIICDRDGWNTRLTAENTA